MRNSKLGGEYGDEETEGGFPFEAGKVYKIGIQVQEDYYKVGVRYDMTWQVSENILACYGQHKIRKQ